MGKDQNYNIASKWGLCFSELFKEHFAKIGSDAMLFKRTQNAYSMVATGRINCIGLQALLKLKRRQDLLSRVYDFIVRSDDTLVMDIAMNNLDPIVFALVPKKTSPFLPKEQRY